MTDYVAALDTTAGFSDEFIADVPLRECVMLVRDGNRVYTNVPHLVTHHSLDGFEWGYAGSGPSDLALNICELAVQEVVPKEELMPMTFRDGECDRLAYYIHTGFRDEFIAPLPRAGAEIPWPEIVDWVDISRSLYGTGMKGELS